MEKELTMKSTKQELFDAYTAMKKKIDDLNAMKEDPVADAAKKQEAAAIEAADDIVKKGVLAPEIVAGYENLCRVYDMRRQQLKELFDIEVEANSLIALINTHKEMEVQLKDKYTVLAEAAQKELDEKKAKIQAEIDDLKKKKDEIEKATREENAVLEKELKQKRQREEEEYTYNLKRQRKLENDAWADEKMTREKELAEREAAVQAEIEDINGKADHIIELENQVAEIPKLVEAAFADGEKKGKADADKSNAFEVRAITQKNEYEQKALKDQVARLEADLEAERDKVITLQEKLDAAYGQMRELAADTVRSTGGVKILDRNDNGK
ncbi:MAG: hypothetical protein Q4P84_04790 [Elusimicrobiales bacterium]|nr:hypothetical protein [Elusimicrobiales bacterium]